MAMLDFLTYLMVDCPAVAAVDGQASLQHMREKLAKNPPASLLYLPDGSAVQFTNGVRVVIYAKPAVTGPPQPIVSLSEPAQGRSPERSQTAAGVPIIPVMRPPG